MQVFQGAWETNVKTLKTGEKGEKMERRKKQKEGRSCIYIYIYISIYYTSWKKKRVQPHTQNDWEKREREPFLGPAPNDPASRCRRSSSNNNRESYKQKAMGSRVCWIPKQLDLSDLTGWRCFYSLSLKFSLLFSFKLATLLLIKRSRSRLFSCSFCSSRELSPAKSTPKTAARKEMRENRSSSSTPTRAALTKRHNLRSPIWDYYNTEKTHKVWDISRSVWISRVFQICSKKWKEEAVRLTKFTYLLGWYAISDILSKKERKKKFCLAFFYYFWVVVCLPADAGRAGWTANGTDKHNKHETNE